MTRKPKITKKDVNEWEKWYEENREYIESGVKIFDDLVKKRGKRIRVKKKTSFEQWLNKL